MRLAAGNWQLATGDFLIKLIQNEKLTAGSQKQAARSN
jgi:hypothetical protein